MAWIVLFVDGDILRNIVLMVLQIALFLFEDKSRLVRIVLHWMTVFHWWYFRLADRRYTITRHLAIFLMYNFNSVSCIFLLWNFLSSPLELSELYWVSYSLLRPYQSHTRIRKYFYCTWKRKSWYHPVGYLDHSGYLEFSIRNWEWEEISVDYLHMEYH